MLYITEKCALMNLRGSNNISAIAKAMDNIPSGANRVALLAKSLEEN